MFAALRRRVGRVPEVEFCDGCGQACTAACRAEARRDRVRTDVLRYVPFAL